MTVAITKDNTDVNKLRNALSVMGKAFEETMLREVSRMWEEINDLDTEVQEGMSNRVGSGFQANEATDYALHLKRKILAKTIEDLNGIKKDITSDVGNLVGCDFLKEDGKPLGGLIGNANVKNFEMSELAIQKLMPPEKVQDETKA